MLRKAMVSLAVASVFVPAADAAATCSRRAVAGDRVLRGVFNPRNDSMAYVEYGEKHFGKTGADFGFELVVGVASPGRKHTLLRLPPERSPGDGRLEPDRWTLDVYWLPSGRFILATDGCRSWLLDAGGSVCTKVSIDRGWYVTNEEVALPHGDCLMLNGLLHDWNPMRGWAQPWLCDSRGRLRVDERGEGGGIRTGSPDRRHVLYDSDPTDRSGYYRVGSREERWLWVSRATGKAKHRVARIGWGSGATWVDSEWLEYFVGSDDPNAAWPRRQQIGIYNIGTHEGQLLTRGPFHHGLCDYRDGRFLVTETPADYRQRFISRLYVIEPLRVRV
jgi:hypothetical protein